MNKRPIGALLISLYSFFLFAYLLTRCITGFLSGTIWSLGILNITGLLFGAVALLPGAILLFLFKRSSIYFLIFSLASFGATSMNLLSFEEITHGPIIGWGLASLAIAYLGSLAKKGTLN